MRFGTGWTGIGRWTDQRTTQFVTAPPIDTSPEPVGVASDRAMVRQLSAREGYNLWAEVYDRDRNPLIALEERHIGGLIGEVAGLTVADVGCGTGRHAIRLAAAGAHVTGLDFSPGMLAGARAKQGAERVRFVLHDVTGDLPFADGSVDRVLCCLVLEHLPDLTTAFRELGRVCARSPQGAIVVSAMHPAMLQRGVRARFYDPRTGEQTEPASLPDEIRDYVAGAIGAGLRIEYLGEHVVDESLAAEYPRGARYLGWPMLLLMKLSRSDEGRATSRSEPPWPDTSCGTTPNRA